VFNILNEQHKGVLAISGAPSVSWMRRNRFALCNDRQQMWSKLKVKSFHSHVANIVSWSPITRPDTSRSPGTIDTGLVSLTVRLFTSKMYWLAHLCKRLHAHARTQHSNAKRPGTEPVISSRANHYATKPSTPHSTNFYCYRKLASAAEVLTEQLLRPSQHGYTCMAPHDLTRISMHGMYQTDNWR